jgi:DNA-directed RNA polymerase specialized sigma24 family protein
MKQYEDLGAWMCARFLGDGDLALDVTQEAVVTAMLSLDLLRHDDRFGAWLTGIALNLCRRRRRHRQESTGRDRGAPRRAARGG